jgi:hypothetical protein
MGGECSFRVFLVLLGLLGIGPAQAQSVAPLPPGVSSTEQRGIYFEVGQPAGRYLSREPRGVVQVIHGGGWTKVGSEEVIRIRPVADRFRRAGYLTLSHTYQPNLTAPQDVRYFYRKARRLSKGKAVCSWGGSAGAHWALFSATQVPIDCVMGEGLPTLLVPAQGLSAKAINKLFLLFGETVKERKRWSPVTRARRLHAQVFLGTSPADLITPIENAIQMKRAAPDRVRVYRVPGGNCAKFIHALVDCQALGDYHRAQIRFLNKQSTSKR